MLHAEREDDIEGERNALDVPDRAFHADRMQHRSAGGVSGLGGAGEGAAQRTGRQAGRTSPSPAHGSGCGTCSHSISTEATRSTDATARAGADQFGDDIGLSDRHCVWAEITGFFVCLPDRARS